MEAPRSSVRERAGGFEHRSAPAFVARHSGRVKPEEIALFGAHEFHHIGVACRHIGDQTAVVSGMGYAPEGPIIEDPAQKVRVQFFVGAGPRLEFVEPVSADSPISAILKRGTQFYHIAYEVADFDSRVSNMEAGGFRPIGPASPAVAFGMRRIVFMMERGGLLVELIEGSGAART